MRSRIRCIYWAYTLTTPSRVIVRCGKRDEHKGGHRIPGLLGRLGLNGAGRVEWRKPRAAWTVPRTWQRGEMLSAATFTDPHAGLDRLLAAIDESPE